MAEAPCSPELVAADAGKEVMGHDGRFLSAARGTYQLDKRRSHQPLRRGCVGSAAAGTSSPDAVSGPTTTLSKTGSLAFGAARRLGAGSAAAIGADTGSTTAGCCTG